MDAAYQRGQHRSEIVNELGNAIRFEIFAPNSAPRPAGFRLPMVDVKVVGPNSKLHNEWTIEEARELHRLLGLIFTQSGED